MVKPEVFRDVSKTLCIVGGGIMGRCSPAVSFLGHTCARLWKARSSAHRADDAAPGGLFGDVLFVAFLACQSFVSGRSRKVVDTLELMTSKPL